MDKNGHDFWTQRPPKTPKPVTNFKSPKILYADELDAKWQEAEKKRESLLKIVACGSEEKGEIAVFMLRTISEINYSQTLFSGLIKKNESDNKINAAAQRRGTSK